MAAPFVTALCATDLVDLVEAGIVSVSEARECLGLPREIPTDPPPPQGQQVISAPFPARIEK